jgi:hypothetical protein
MSKESKAQKKGEGGSYNAASKKVPNPYHLKKISKSKNKKIQPCKKKRKFGFVSLMHKRRFDRSLNKAILYQREEGR